MIATSTRCIAWSSSARPLTKIRPSWNTVPSVGASRLSVRVGGNVTGVDPVTSGRARGGRVLLVRRCRTRRPVTFQSPPWGSVDAAGPRRRHRVRAWPASPSGSRSRAQGAVGLQVLAGVAVEQRDPDRATPLSSVAVPARSRCSDWPPVTVPVTLSLPSGGASPGTWALIVSEPRLVDDVVSPRSSVART